MKLPDPSSRECVEIFNIIMKFMGDSGRRPTSNKQELECVHYVITRGISNPVVRDEILCQLMRQVTKNPKEYVL